MAKQPAEQQNVISFSVKSLNPDLRKQVEGVKGRVLDIAKSLGVAREKCSEIAPKVIRLYDALVYHFGQVPGAKRFRFIDFVRMIDPTTPKASADYINHRTYYTIRYMKTLTDQAGRASTKGTTQAGGLRSNAIAGLARALKCIAGLPGVDGEQIIAQAVTELGLTPNVAARLRKRIAATEPLFTITLARGNATAAPNPMAPDVAPDAKTGHAMEQPGQSVREMAGRLGASLKGKTAAHGKLRKAS